MPESKSPKTILDADDEYEFSHWQLPDITKESSQEPSNLFGKFSEAHTPTPVSAAEKSMAPPTMAQIEDIRAAAEREGFEQGQQEGHQQGLEQGRLEGLEHGHQQGFSQGEQQGLDAGQTKVNQVVEQFNHIISQFEQPLSILDNEIEAELLAMTISLAKSVIGHELNTHPEHILSALRQGVDALPLKDQVVKIRLNQADAELVSQCYRAEQLQKNQWQIDIDPTLSNGDCMIDSVRSSVDLRVEQRISQVFSELDAQSNQLAKNVSQQKSETSRYQTSTVDDLDAVKPMAQPHSSSETLDDNDKTHQPEPDMGTATQAVLPVDESTNKVANEAVNETVNEVADEAVPQAESPKKDSSLSPSNTIASEQDVPMHGHSEDADKNHSHADQGNIDEHSSTSATE
jgi:flagellar assembly protein FliH